MSDSIRNWPQVLNQLVIRFEDRIDFSCQFRGLHSILYTPFQTFLETISLFAAAHFCSHMRQSLRSI